MALRRRLPGPVLVPPFLGALWRGDDGSGSEDYDSDFEGADAFDDSPSFEDSCYGSPMPYMVPGFVGSVEGANEIWDYMDLPDVAAWYYD